MRFLIDNRLYCLPFLAQTDAPWQLRYCATEGLILNSPEEVDVFLRGEPTGEKTVQWTDEITVATGEDARKLWDTVRRVLVADKGAIDVDAFLENAGAHDLAVQTGRELLLEEQRIGVEAAQEKLQSLKGLTVEQIRQMENFERAREKRNERGPLMIVPPQSGGGGLN